MLEPESFTSCTEEFILQDKKVSNLSFSKCANGSEEHGHEQLDVPYAVMEILIAIFAVIGNALVIVVFLREKRLRKRTNYYIVSLALADFFVGLFGIPFAVLVRKFELGWRDLEF